MGKVIGIKIDFQIAFFCDRQRIGDGIGTVGKKGLHLFGRLEIKLGPFHFEAIALCQRLSGLDADQRILRLGQRLFQIMDIIGGDERQIQLSRQTNQPFAHCFLFRQAVVGNFEIKITFSHGLRKPEGRLLCRLEISPL